MARVLVTEQIADNGLQMLKDAGHDVDVKLNLSPKELIEEIKGATALIIRSATQVTAEVLEAADLLQVVGRAGIGLDNVDVATATRRGVMVVNAPQSNILSAAEHTLALLLAQARFIPQAHSALVQGRWERTKWEGVELYGKTLGIIGLGRVGTLVAQRSLSFGMRLIAYDPFVSPDRAKKIGVELKPLAQVMEEADFITIHLPKNKETANLINKEMLAKAKPTLRIVNTARGGIIDEEALYEALAAKKLGGASLDVFATEPSLSSPLYSLDSVVVTPHLGASTQEAQDKAGLTIAEQLLLALNGDFVPFAVNINAAEASESVKPFLGIAEYLGKFLASLQGGLPHRLEIEYDGAIASEDTRILTLSSLKGLFSSGTNEPVSYVNAPQLASERGLELKEANSLTPKDYVSLITLRSEEHAVSGTLAGPMGTPRVVEIDGHRVEIPPANNMLVVRNSDQPGMIGLVGTAVGQAGVSISSMGVSPASSDHTALMVLSIDGPLPQDAIEKISETPGIIYARVISTTP